VGGTICDHDRLEARVNKQPSSEMCFVCGLRSPVGLRLLFHDDGVSEVRADLTIPSAYQGYPGIAHGGIVAAILDETLGRVGLIGNPNRFTVTVRMEIKYRLPVPVETPLVVIGTATRPRGRLVQASGEVRLPDGRLAAEAEATLTDMPKELATPEQLAALGWAVSP
jgi:acyl-coenzyme A thioesterase PaaI-like protein